MRLHPDGLRDANVVYICVYVAYTRPLRAVAVKWPECPSQLALSNLSWDQCFVPPDPMPSVHRRLTSRFPLSLYGELAAAVASLMRCDSEFGDIVATSESLEVEDAVAFNDSVAAIRRHMDDGSSNENVFEVSSPTIDRGGDGTFWG